MIIFLAMEIKEGEILLGNVRKTTS